MTLALPEALPDPLLTPGQMRAPMELRLALHMPVVNVSERQKRIVRTAGQREAPHRRARSAGCVCAAGPMSALSVAWDVTQKVVLGATAVGLLVCGATATTSGGRRRLKALADEFQKSPEGAQCFQLLQYLVLVLVARTFEFITGVTGALTLVYLGIFAMQVQHWIRMIPGPEEARARVEALEKGVPYVKPVALSQTDDAQG